MSTSKFWSLSCLLATLLLLLTIGTEARTVRGHVTVVSNKVSKIAKFSFKPVGTSVIKGKLVYRGEARGAIYLFMDTEWNDFHKESDECVRMSKATAKIVVGTRFQEGKGYLSQQETKEVSSNAFEFTFTWNIEHRVRSYGYYLVIGDCNQGAASPKKFKTMDYEFVFLNNEVDHFPADEEGLYTLYILCFLSLAGFAGYRISRNTKSSSSNSLFASLSNGPPQAATSMLIIAYVCQMVSILFEITHFFWYSYDGKGLFMIDFAAEVLEGLAQTSLAYLLLALAGGWTLVEGTITSKSEGAINPEALGEDHPATLFLSFMTIVTFLLQLLNKLVLFDEFTKFHDHDTWPGFFLVLVRLSLAIFFTFQIYSTLNHMMRNKRAGGKGHTQQFMKRLATFGLIWFWVFPVLVFISGIFAHYLRHRLVAGGVLLLQTICLIILSNQIFDESSAYSRASLHRGVILGGSGA